MPKACGSAPGNHRQIVRGSDPASDFAGCWPQSLAFLEHTLAASCAKAHQEEIAESSAGLVREEHAMENPVPRVLAGFLLWDLRGRSWDWRCLSGQLAVLVPDAGLSFVVSGLQAQPHSPAGPPRGFQL